MRADALQQLFVRPRAGGLELLLVLESVAGDRERVTLKPPRPKAGRSAADGTSGAGGGSGAGGRASADGEAELMATEHLARWLVRHGCTLAPRLRVRRESGGALTDAPALHEALRRAVKRLEEDERGWE